MRVLIACDLEPSDPPHYRGDVRKDNHGDFWIDCTNGHIAFLDLDYKPQEFYVA